MVRSLSLHAAVRVEQGQLFQIDEVGTLLRVALSQNGHASADDAACFLYQSFQRLQALAGGDHVVHDEDALALHQCGVRAVQIQLLLLGGGDGMHRNAENVPHVQLGGFPCQHVLLIPGLTGHLVGQRNALGLRGDDVVIFRRAFQQLPGAGHGQLLIAEDYKSGNGQRIIYRADGQIPLKAHAHRADDIFTAIRIADEFGVRLTLEHTTEGHLIADELAKTGLCMAVGPSLNFATKVEVRNKSWKTPGILSRAGCHVSIITDCTVIPQQYLPLCAGMAVKAGMDPFDALRAITIHPAEHIGIADRVGSLEAGKDADLVITDGSPFEVSTTVRRVLIGGKTVHAV